VEEEERKHAYAVHHRDRSWKSAPVLRRRLREVVKEKARQSQARYEEAAEQSNQWRGRCEELEAELDRFARALTIDELRRPVLRTT
jgi:hypothetical protein